MLHFSAAILKTHTKKTTMAANDQPVFEQSTRRTLHQAR